MLHRLIEGATLYDWSILIFAVILISSGITVMLTARENENDDNTRND